MSPICPSAVTVFAYQVGFGDSFLVRFQYPNFRRHILIDFGSFRRPEGAGSKFMQRTASCIHDRCDGKLDAVIVTHRHSDHINGFATDGDGPGEIIASCQPDVVVQPWTEDPAAKRTATEPTAAFMGTNAGLGDKALQRGRAFVSGLDDLHRLAKALCGEATRFSKSHPQIAQQLSFQGELNLNNLSAVKNLIAMAGKASMQPPRYVYFGSDSGLEQVLPGVQVKVLGPPTLEQSDKIRKQATEAPDEFWHLLAKFAGHPEVETKLPLPNAKGAGRVPPHARWLVQRLHALRGRELLEIVRILDDVLNNTSVILLFKIGAKRLLFPGDAQLENWQYALSQPGVAQELKHVNFYKVGHHGSLNATPKKSLWKAFVHAAENDHDPERLVTLLSTMADVHGDKDARTEVPRETLVDELKKKSQFFTTEDLAPEPGACTEIPIPV